MDFSKKKAFLFDFDGTLADTMEDNFLAWKKAFENYQVFIEREDYFPLEGMRLTEIAKTISKKYSLSASPEEIVSLKNKIYLAEHKFKFFDGTSELVDFLKERNYLLAIVSASPREKLVKTVPSDFLKKFDVVIAGEDSSEGKPSPAPYLAAIEKLNLSPLECIVVENAPLGVKSAKSANVFCFALTTTLPTVYFKEADMIFENISTLKNYLETIYR